MTRHFKVYDGCHPHFITSAITHWIPVFNRDSYFRVLVDSIIHCTEYKGLQVHAYVIMPNHFHMICSQVDGHLTDTIRDFKGYTARQIAPMLEADGRMVWLRAMKERGGSDVHVWQGDYHPEQVNKREFFEQKMGYIHDNPRRAGFIEDPCYWKYSSAGFYYNDQESIIPITVVEW